MAATGMVDGREPEERDAERYRDLPARVAVKFSAEAGFGDDDSRQAVAEQSTKVMAAAVERLSAGGRLEG